MTRWVIGAIGVACGLWGASLALPLVSWSFVTWLLGGPIVHDVLVAPLVGGIGLLLAQACPPHWARLIAGGLATSGILALIAAPLANGTGLLVALGVVWLVVAAAGLGRVGLGRKNSANRPEPAQHHGSDDGGDRCGSGVEHSEHPDRHAEQDGQNQQGLS
ncbi:hypothetical protein NLX83_19820 [Allokutzneria sp. A3M-2-11 16]|uniref:hypothetical protein n=1 Tax=Allokutzneria sp. A3M-2-11 16 TaxID=2962043 RepID=UPI0020B87674|nr:hypothetical protein [Allokutzneria sp. A3M-2-11 16]MCP3801511.1 hypothetical protein [Allokutzneria sp. A3M-2-11 16]